MELKQKRRDRWQKSQLILVLALVLVVAISGTLAWLTYVRKIQTATLVDVPEIYLEGPEDAVSQLIPLGDIDVTNGTSREYVFRIVTNKDNQYRIQFAHTTNIDFQYTIFPAQKGEGGGSSRIDYLGNQYTFDTGKTLSGGYLNRNEGTGLAFETGTYHDKTYATDDALGAAYIKVQSNAEPLYWRSADSIAFPAERNEEGYYINYYVLRVSWGESLVNNKETDMVYLMVETSGTDGQ